MTSTSTTNDFSEAAGLSFSAYSADHLAALLRIWVEHSWPISKEETFNICDRCGWTMMQGDDESFTTSIQSANYNQFDGSVRYDANDPGFISGIDVELTPRTPTESISRTTPIVKGLYGEYLNAISGAYGNPTAFSNEAGQSSIWTLPHHVSIHLILNQTYLKIRIHSPAQTKRTTRTISHITDHRNI